MRTNGCMRYEGITVFNRPQISQKNADQNLKSANISEICGEMTMQSIIITWT
jgi:hypothetical protein